MDPAVAPRAGSDGTASADEPNRGAPRSPIAVGGVRDDITSRAPADPDVALGQEETSVGTARRSAAVAPAENVPAACKGTDCSR